MHIAFLTLESPYEEHGGGIAAYLRAMTKALIECGNRVTIIAHARERGIHRLQNGALRLVHIRLPSLHWYLSRLLWGNRTAVLPLRQFEWSFAFRDAALKTLENDPPDVIESGETGALFLAHSQLAPLVIRLHGSDYVFRNYSGAPLSWSVHLNRRLERMALRRARAVTSPSHFQANEVAHEMDWTPERIHVIPNPINPELLDMALNTTSFAPSNKSSPVILYVGRLAPVKGIVPLLAAAEIVRQACPQAQFVLVGPWQMPEPAAHWRLDGARHNHSNVTWLGPLRWQDLVEWYRRATLFVMPSYYETFCISALEAMAFRLPIIAMDVGGLSEVIEDNVTGILVKPGDRNLLAKVILHLLNQPSLSRQMGQLGFERMIKQFTVERVVGQALKIYQQSIAC